MFCIGYKVVRTGKGTFWSAMRCVVGATKYLPFRWTIPLANSGPLTLFRDRKSALDWLEQEGLTGNRNFRIRRCLFVPTRVIIVWATDGSWELVYNMPSGTILAKRIMII